VAERVERYEWRAVDSKTRIITALITNGGPCGDGAEVELSKVDRKRSRLRCLRCGASTVVRLPGGRIDRPGLLALDAGVERLHGGDA